MYRQRLSLVALALLLAVPVFAQKFTASIRGTVTDPTEAPVSAAKVTLANEETGLTRTVSTNPAGNHSFPDLPVGSYRVEVEFAGFKTAVRSKIVINVADVRDVNVKLETGAVTEMVSVEANPNAVKTVGAEIAGLVSGEQVRELPLNGRNFLQLTLLQPGVTADEGLNTVSKGLSGGANISVSGGSITSNLWLIDGADNVDHGSNRTILVYPLVDAIEEFKIQRNNYGAEFGGAGGGQINLVTRGGDNPQIVEQINALIPTLYPSAEKERGGEAQTMVGFGQLGPYAGGGPLWNQAPWKNNQDLFVIKDDYSAVFGSHFVKAGVLYSYNKKNEEPANASQESVQLNGAAGYLGPNGYLAGRTTGNALSDLLLQDMVWNTAEIQTNRSVEQRWSDLEFYLADSIKLSPRLTADVGLRASHLTPSWEASDRLANFDPGTANSAYGTSPCNGMTYVPGKNPCAALGLSGGSDGPNRYLVPTKLFYFGPRVGLAWDVFGSGKTSLRGGFGIFYQRERVSPGLGIGQNPPLSGVGAVTRTLESNQPVVGQVAASYGAPGNALEQKAANSHNYQWNLSVQHEVFRNTVLEVAYVGNQGKDLVGQVNLNEIAPENRAQFSRTGSASLRPLNGVGSIGNGTVALWTHGRDSIYHGLQTAVTSRFGEGSVLSLAYTWSKAISNTGISNADGPGLSGNNAYTDSTHPELDRARGAPTAGTCSAAASSWVCRSSRTRASS